MGKTQVRGEQIGDSEIQRDDLDVTTAGQAVIRKVIQGAGGVTISSTGADSGTGDVTINAGNVEGVDGTRHIYVGGAEPSNAVGVNGDVWIPDTATVLTGLKGFVNHGSVAGTARPSGYASIEWFGSVEPTNMEDGDTWVNTAP